MAADEMPGSVQGHEAGIEAAATGRMKRQGLPTHGPYRATVERQLRKDIATYLRARGRGEGGFLPEPDDPRIDWGPGEWLAEVERLEKELLRAEGRIEQRYANEQVRQMRRTGYCPTCGAEA